MDRSVDSIGSCSLDVDAESTDFSDTSGSLNVCTPLSGKDFTRDFTLRIHERCQLPVHHLTKTVLDPNSGKISTILSSPPALIESSAPPQQTSPVAKKPSYLNLACCVNGYSNLTQYDSKYRQSINKSREVSPIRPITHTVNYNRSENTNYLGVPIFIPISNSVNDNSKKPIIMDRTHSIVSPENHFYTKSQHTAVDINTAGRDVPDNINKTSCTTYFKKTTKFTATTSHSVVKLGEKDSSATSKSFIQQRVERLYGTGAFAQGLYSPKKPKSNVENGATVAHVLAEKSQNSSKFNSDGHGTSSITTISSNSSSSTVSAGGHDVENMHVDNDALPVLRHLRPEFRAQLPALSPKRLTRATKLTSTNALNGKLNGTTISSNGSNNNYNNKSTSNIIDTETKGHSDIDRMENVVENTITSTNYDIESDKRHNHLKFEQVNDSDVMETMNSVNKMHLTEGDENQMAHNKQKEETASAMIPMKRKSLVIETTDDSPNATLSSPTTTTASKVFKADANGNHKTEQTKDALCFLKTVHAERDRLIALAIGVETELEALLQRDDIEEEVLGFLRSAAGKARLLATKKFKQFEGLCNNSLNQIPGDGFPPPTSADLQGFWDMVSLQVTNIDSLFEELDLFRANNWKNIPREQLKAPQGSKITKRPVQSKTNASTSASQAIAAAKKSAASLAATQKREAQRKQLMEMKRKHRQAMTTNTATDSGNTNVNVTNSDEGNGDECSSTNETDR